MIPLPQNVDQIRGEHITLRFSSIEDCGYEMLYQAGAARLAHKMIALGYEAEYARPDRVGVINAEQELAIAAFNKSCHVDGEGQHCLILTVGEAISFVSPIEQIKMLSALGVPFSHKFEPAQVGSSATQLLERFQRSIDQVAVVANTQELGMGSPTAPGMGR